MNISICIGLVILILYFITYGLIKNKEKRNKIFLLLSFVFLFIILEIRKPISDLEYFITIFKNMGGDFSNLSMSRYAFLYRLLSVIVGKIWLNERFFIFIVDIITLAGPYFIIKKYSKNYLLAILLFIALGTYYMQFFIIRQALAISFLLFSIKFLNEDKPIRFFALVTIAGLFHTSAFVFAILYLLKYLKVSRQTFVFWVLIFIIIFIFKRQIALLFASSTDYAVYIGTKYDAANEGQWKLLIYILLFAFCFLLKSGYEKDKYSQFFLSAMLVAIYFQLIATSSTSFVRVANYFCFPIYILSPNVIKNLKDKRTRQIMELVVIFCYFLFVFMANPIKGYEIFF